MGWEFAAVGGVVFLIVTAGYFVARAVRKGHEAQPRLDIEEARNEALENQAERARGPLFTRDRFRAFARRRVRETEDRD